MSFTLGRALMTAGIWLVAALLLWWPQLPAAWRRLLSLLTSVVGLVFLVIAVSTEGVRESPTVTVFLIGTPYVTQQATALASLPYYVLTAFFLLLGSAGLTVGDHVAERLQQRFLATAVGLTVVVALLRFLLEKAAAPPPLTQLFGVTWLAPVVGAFLYLGVRSQGKGFGRLLGALAIYGLAARGTVAALYVLATRLQLGTHYDVTRLVRVLDPWGRVIEFAPGSGAQLVSLVLLPQLVAWPLYTIVAGLIGAGLAALVSGQWRPPALAAREAPPQPAPQAE